MFVHRSLVTKIRFVIMAVFLAMMPALLIASDTLSPGKPIPASGEKQYGVIGCRKGSVSGAADVFGKGEYDLFIGLRSLYPFECFDSDNVPVYGTPMNTNSDYSHGYVFQYSRVIYALTVVGNNVILLKFDKSKKEFKQVASDALPQRGRNVCGFVGDDKKLHVFYTCGNGAGYYPNDSHAADYHPFDGSGFWRGGIPADNVYYARWATMEMEKLEMNTKLEPEGQEEGLLFGCSGTTIVHLGPGSLRNRLVAVNKLGVFRCYINTSPTGMVVGGTAYAVDNTDAKVLLRHPIYNPNPVSFPNSANGLSDLIVSDSGRLWHYPFKGMHKGDYPIYGEKRPVLAAGQDLYLGALPVISPGDVDSDGRIDFIAGNDAGELLFIKNIGPVDNPVFANPVELLVDGRHYRERGGYGGSIQGPGEANWGYTCPTLFDWNMDGKLDIIMNSINANIVVMIQQDGKHNPPEFGRPLTVFKNSLDLHLSWRTQPGVTTWGGATVPCIIANDEKNQLRQYYRIDNQNVRQGTVLKLSTGQAIQAHDKRYGGQFGRTKIVPTDWDMDGRIDLLIGTGRAMSIPGSGGIPDNLQGNQRQASVLFLRNLGSNEEPKFDYPAHVAYNGSPIKLGTHSCSPAPVSLGPKADLFVAEENGRIICYPRQFLSWD